MMDKKERKGKEIACILIMLIGCCSSVEHADGTSQSTQSREKGNYEFQYSVRRKDGSSNSRSERGNTDGMKVGSYSLTDTDGRQRAVEYIADEDGFRVIVRSNEPGTMNLPTDHSSDNKGKVHIAANYPPGHAHYLPLSPMPRQ